MTQDRHPDHNALYRVAEQQAGYFTTAQALASGFSRPLLTHHIRRGRYQRIQHGLHRLVQFPHTQHEDLVIAQLSVGPQSVISHDSALAVYQLSDITPAEIHIIAPRSTSRRRRGIRLHSQALAADEITVYEGLRLTTVERTIADMAACGLADEQIELAIREAVARGLTTPRRLAEQASRRRGRTRHLIERQLALDRKGDR